MFLFLCVCMNNGLDKSKSELSRLIKQTFDIFLISIKCRSFCLYVIMIYKAKKRKKIKNSGHQNQLHVEVHEFLRVTDLFEDPTKIENSWSNEFFTGFFSLSTRIYNFVRLQYFSLFVNKSTSNTPKRLENEKRNFHLKIHFLLNLPGFWLLRKFASVNASSASSNWFI